MSQLSPVNPRERVVTLDVLRGFALCGVLIANLFWIFSGRAWDDRPDGHALDAAARWFVMVFVNSKAQTLLTFLFGFGFATQLLRAQQRCEPVTGVYVRRLVALFVIGALHVVLLWWGDVTWGYAVAGFGLLAFQRASNRARIGWALFLVLVPHLVLAVPSVQLAAIRVFIDPPKNGAGYLQDFLAAMHGSDYPAVMWNHVRFALAFEVPIYAWYYPWLLGRFLLGYVAGTERWFEGDGAGHLARFRKLLVYGLIAGAAGTAMVIVEGSGALDGYELTVPARLGAVALHELGLLGLAAVYLAALVLCMQRPAWRRVLRIVAPAGRMPLTTYLSQSAICTFLFYGWGLGWSGHVGPAGCLGLALAIFALQVGACRLWLRWFRFGPLEWVWRTVVYLRPQPMRM